jgi:hypothetical protein
VGAGAQTARGAPGAALSREVGARAAGTRSAPRAALSRVVGAGATRTRGTPGVALRREADAGAQVTRGDPGAALSREAGTTPPSPLPRLRRPPRPRHQRAIICMWYSSISTPVTAYAPSRRCNCGGCQFVGFYLRLILQSHRLWCSRCDCGGMLEYIW